MRSIDIPQADSLDQVRRVVVAICAGARRSHAVRRATGISARHVAYALHAARILGWLRVQEKQLSASPTGEALLQVRPGSPAECATFERAIRSCAIMNLLAPQLLDAAPPDPLALARHIAGLSDLAVETARRRVQTLLAWRHRILHGEVEPPRPAAMAPLRHPTPAVTPAAPAAARPLSEDRGAARPPAEELAAIAPHGVAQGLALAAPPLLLRRVALERFGPLKSVVVDLSPFSVVIGGAGAGKSALLDSLLLVSDALRGDLPYALARRGVRLRDLVYHLPGHGAKPGNETFSLAFDFAQGGPAPQGLRYELELGSLADGTPAVLRESLATTSAGGRRAVSLHRPAAEGSATLHGETDPRYRTTIEPGTGRLALSFLPRVAGFPAAEQLRVVLAHGLHRVLLHPDALRRPCSPLRSSTLASDGSNLALVAQSLALKDPPRFAQWQAQICALLPDVESLQVVVRSDDQHVYLALALAGGAQLPAWRMPDSTLRALALTLLPCIAGPGDLYLIEEAEAGLPSELLRGVLAALAALPRGGGQVLLTAHGGGLTERMAHPDQILHLRREGGMTVVAPAGASSAAL